MSESGSPVWGPWRLDYTLADSPDQEGVVIRQVYFRNRFVFYKASLPSLRMEYEGD